LFQKVNLPISCPTTTLNTCMNQAIHSFEGVVVLE
jgi:hypothetical protein